MAVNKAIVIGNLGADPKVRALPSGQNVANLSLATNERFTEQQRRPATVHRMAPHCRFRTAGGNVRAVSQQRPQGLRRRTVDHARV